VELQAGFSLGVAPRFHRHPDWKDRLRLNDGIVRAGRRVHPGPGWRPLTGAELGLLVSREPSGAGLLAIPGHLRSAWWAQAAQATTPLGAPSVAYDRFVAALLEFLRFKELPLPAVCEVEVTASRPGQPGTRLDPATGDLAGLVSAARQGPTSSGSAVAVINLGDEATHLVLLNLGGGDRQALLRGRPEACVATLPPTALAMDFLEAFPTYPLIRVRLDPTEGLWFPGSEVAYDGWTVGKRDLDVVLCIREGGR
jgi:hypothetical protein